MLTATLEGTLPVINPDMTDAMRRVSVMVEKVIRLNLAEGGRPARWVSNYGRHANLANSAIAKTLTATSGPDWAQVETVGVPYARIHNYGGQIYPREIGPNGKYKMANLFWRKYIETKEPRWKAMAISVQSGRGVAIPARPYMVLTSEDIQAIAAEIGQFIITYDNINALPIRG